MAIRLPTQQEIVMNPLPFEPCRIIGVLDDGIASLSPAALIHIEQAELVIGASRTLALFADYFSATSEQRDLAGKLSQVPEWIRDAQSQNRRVIVLATGDPLCHGIAGFLQSRLCIEACEVLPNVSTIQLACARFGIPWQGMKICSIHNRDAGEWRRQSGPEHGLYPLLLALQQHQQVAVLTSPVNTPARVARLLVEEGMADQFQMAVAEKLLQPDEKLHTFDSPEEAVDIEFADLNVLLLWRTQPLPSPILFGLSDDRFKQRKPEKGLITKREVRAVSLARMQLKADSIVWDIGAGSGSVGLEAARIARNGFVYAIEKNSEDFAIATENSRTLGLHNYHLIHSKAPNGIENWPDPDAVFIGGSGGELAELINTLLKRLKPEGWLVMNFVTFENLSAAMTLLKEQSAHYDITQLQASRSRPILQMQRLAAENPVWIVCAQRNREAAQ
jgi:precorrin-6Y C5,15-methyltransferase (decarboxylating)